MKEFEEKFQKVIDHYKHLDKVWDDFRILTDSPPDSRIGDAVWTTFHLYTEEVSVSARDHFNYLAWFIYDNECGKNGLKATLGGKQVKITTVKQLARLVYENQIPA